MSFTITLQTNTSEPNAVNKTITDILELSGVLRDGTSIIDPVIYAEADIADLTGCNYMTISAFGRSYFVTDIVSETASMVTISGHVDVLSTYKDALLENSAIIRKQENDWNLYLNDGSLFVYQNPIVTTHEFPSGFSGQSYIMLIAGRHGGGTFISPGADITVKTTAGLAAYAYAKIGCPYWYGTFGQIADAALYNERKAAYPSYYTASDYSSQYGQQVYDCVGLIKGYRWSDTINGVPVYNPAQDVAVDGLFGQCTNTGVIGDTAWESGVKNHPGVCLFTSTMSHVGVSMGDGTEVDARGHDYGVVHRNITATGFTRWGIPDWAAPRYIIPDE